MRKPFPIREPLSSGKSEVFSQPWAQSFTETHAYYNEALRWADPGRADYGKVEPPAAYRRTGLLAYADGVNWNPGAGAGLYKWSGAAWEKGFFGTLPTYPLTKYFESTEQTITSAGALTLAHGFGVKPKLYLAALICKTAEHGYSVNNEVGISHTWESSAAADSLGISIVPDSTNLNVRYGSDANVILILNKTTGIATTITLANWKAIFRAWA